MSYTRNIHFRGNEAVLDFVINNGEQKTLNTLIVNKATQETLLQSNAEYPHILIDPENASDFWDLVREEIISIGRGKQDKYLRCLLLHKIQKELQH